MAARTHTLVERISPPLVIHLLFGLINVAEKVFQIFLDPDIDINGYMDGFDFHRCHLHFVTGAACALEEQQRHGQA
jgi:hypothetical protein